MPLIISYPGFKEALRPGGQLSNARHLRALIEGVQFGGRGFEFQSVAGVWKFCHTEMTGENDWIDSQKIYDVLKAAGRIVAPGSPPALATMAGSISPEAQATTKGRKRRKQTSVKANPARKRKIGRSARSSKKSRRSRSATARKSAQTKRRKTKRRS